MIFLLSFLSILATFYAIYINSIGLTFFFALIAVILFGLNFNFYFSVVSSGKATFKEKFIFFNVFLFSLLGILSIFIVHSDEKVEQVITPTSQSTNTGEVVTFQYEIKEHIEVDIEKHNACSILETNDKKAICTFWNNKRLNSKEKVVYSEKRERCLIQRSSDQEKIYDFSFNYVQSEVGNDCNNLKELNDMKSEFNK